MLPAGSVRVLVATRPVDFRKGMDGLALLVQETLGADPFTGAIFVLSPEQMDLALEELEQHGSALEVEIENETPARQRPSPSRKINRGALPAHLPREEIVVDVASKICVCCSGALHCIGEDVSERLDIQAALFKVLVTRRPKYACRACEQGVVQAPAPERLVPCGLPTEALVAHVIVSKYADHSPLYRQAQIYARQGVNLDRSTLADWVGRAAFTLRPVHERLLAHLKRSPKLFADETTAPVLDPGRGRTKTGQLWAYARDDRPWGGSDPPGVAYVYAPDRTAGRPMAHLSGFTGVLQVDGYAGYKALAAKGDVRLAYCWAHVRRGFYKLHIQTPLPVTTEVLARIGELYRIEEQIRGGSPHDRQAVRQERSRPILETLKPLLEGKLRLISRKSKLAEATRYALSHWNGLMLYLDDGRIEIDSNIVERSIRPLALQRKNALFAGSDGGGEHWAIIASLIETCKLNGLNPQPYLADVLTRIVNGHPQSRIDELLPWQTLHTESRL
jgi:transposase